MAQRPPVTFLAPESMRIPALFLPLVIVSPALSQRVAEIEPNDTSAQAQPLTAGMHVAANLVAGENDWFRFTLAAPARVHLRTSGNFNGTLGVDTFVAIYDPIGGSRLAWDDNSDGSHSDCGVVLAAGNYTVLVAGKLAATAGDYGLDFAALPIEPIDTNEGAEPNGSPATGGVPTPITLGDVVAGELPVANDVDWFTFSLTNLAIVQAIAFDDGGTPQLDQTRLQLHQETSPGIWSPFGTVGQNSNSHRAFNLGHGGMLSPGNYALEVSSATATATGSAPWNYTKTGRYALRTSVIALPGNFTVGEAAEPNASPTNTTTLGLGNDALGSIAGNADGDWFAFTINGPTTIGAMCETGSAPGCTGTSLSVFDANGVLVTLAVGGANTHARLIATLRTPGTYFIEVAGGSIGSFGNYRLHLGGTDAMFVPTTVTIQPAATNACPGSTGLRPNFGSANGERPFLGSTYVMRLAQALPNTIVVAMAGLSGTAAGSVPLPFDLGALGAPGCFLRIDPLVTRGQLTDAAGATLVDLPLAAVPALRGTELFTQCLCLDPFVPGNTLQLTVSNDVRLIVGDRSF
jgi:hypothetical protein